MVKTLAFDVYGTLIDTHGVVEVLQTMIGEQAAAFSRSWRDKQLEYSFRRGLMGSYETFTVCTRQSLEYTVQLFGCDLSQADRSRLMEAYLVLPVFDDVPVSLKQLQQSGHQLFAFSNGTRESVNNLLSHAGISGYFRDIVSVDELKTFKPDPACYRHLLSRTGGNADATWLISSNPFDVIGAIGAGLSAAWVQRSESAIFDSWDIEPTVTVNTLADLGGCLG